jgi:uncharacterized protein YndB with AHSA1/START domain
MGDYGMVTEGGTVRFRRVLPGPTERVWAYLAESKKRERWLAPGPAELRIGGRVELHFPRAAPAASHSPGTGPMPERRKPGEAGISISGCITCFEPPHVLAYTWEEEGSDPSEIIFDLIPRHGSVILLLTHRRLDDLAAMIRVASRWNTHLRLLADRLYRRDPQPLPSTRTEIEASPPTAITPSSSISAPHWPSCPPRGRSR